MSDWTQAHEYRVRAMFKMPTREHDPGDLSPTGALFSEWNHNLEFVARLAQDLREEYGMKTEVIRRRRAETLDYEQYVESPRSRREKDGGADD